MGDEPEEAFYGQGLWGMLSYVFSGAGSDVVSLMIIATSDDEDLVDRTKENFILGYTPGGSLYRQLVGNEEKPKVLRQMWRNVYDDEDVNTFFEAAKTSFEFLTAKYDYNFGE